MQVLRAAFCSYALRRAHLDVGVVADGVPQCGSKAVALPLDVREERRVRDDVKRRVRGRAHQRVPGEGRPVVPRSHDVCDVLLDQHRADRQPPCTTTAHL